ncbi:hypothetical protein PHYSODRAFT_286709 [Phytophthora sojae]|uniref:RxLR effector protein n=1 Tax=Phytophthora sojae (strain P6497) TaxID=1094619 RepID=G4ZQY1_PHYSP|nr:hypothetical protein PHYSODRAFT_286709 [Phytophthora sojae]EGZ13929.1 hypothetical protein PHYSODRAFT_286709 [Phytophthora sojae]|eukprot:XP_009531358.1 hypothetical protein PHYSODRAFT_286709 [Phytophthora sojae]
MQFRFALLVVAAVFLVLCDGLSASTDVDAVRSKTAFSGRLSSEENVSSTDKRNRFLRTSKFGDGDSDDRYDTTVDE